MSEFILKHWKLMRNFIWEGGVIRNAFRNEQGWWIGRELSIWADQIGQ